MGDVVGRPLALLLAERRDVACVVAQAAPTELSTVPAFLHGYFDRAFGPGSDDAWSPARHTDTLVAPVLLAYAENDTVVGPDQGTAFAAADPAARLTVLPSGDVPFAHSYVDGAALAAHLADEQRFVADGIAGWVPGRSRPASAPADPPPALAPPAATPQPVAATTTTTKKRAKRPTRHRTKRRRHTKHP